MAIVKTGTFTGSDAAQVIELGFIPDFFMTISLTDNAVKTFLYEKNMTDATGAYMCEGDDDIIGSNGFTPYTGGEPTISSGTTPGASKGITIGTSAQQNGVATHYLAICSG